MLRIGVLGLSHDHVWDNLNQLVHLGGAQIVAAADGRSELRERVRDHGCELVLESAEQLLDDVRVDAVYIYSDNRHSAELAVMAAERGIDVMVEKPMAADLEGALRMQAAARSAGTLLMVNWPFFWWPSLQHALKLVAEGFIGTPFQVTYRAAHAGPAEAGCSPAFVEWLSDPHKNGAGALMDYCSYGAALTCLLLGLPARVTAVSGRLRKADLDAEDNAVLLMEHQGAISQSTASWTQIGHLTSYIPVFYGDEGTLLVERDGVRLATRQHQDGLRVEVPKPAADLSSSAAFFTAHIRSRDPIEGLCSAETGVATQHVLEAGLLSSRRRCAVQLPLPADSAVLD
ncbi:MAG: gfo/Idh/MocA family oxidoreductase [Candidatus Nephthysia bennettiae]|uniref:Gfo/Idh/MocA family oxidoreductase n=1 Tax=Candidatus Nephthysia bennettiae TaxID=3127016 RepID=A0A934K1S8_9BACT|nr:Gfo/Idh/MocA family oxidoreductase [Candidatus Dormibacteraeota bacterium]MBJ7613366.1 Gfo/Idh/MocA family oxidoreductase [Candidatus Dormibacteraeota bacterium]PZR85238.1 MAG: gfo/Idh/MocA family oxidoreductase [Candidatus Dormibacteraeota bacterium]